MEFGEKNRKDKMNKRGKGRAELYSVEPQLKDLRRRMKVI